METNHFAQTTFIELLLESDPLAGDFVKTVIALGQSNREIPTDEETIHITTYIDNNQFLPAYSQAMDAECRIFQRKCLASGVMGYCMPFLTDEQLVTVRTIVYNIVEDPVFYKRKRNGANS